ncbi:MAG: hypothetical protein KAS78_03760 [Candidatus Pacebacteria bacterium]|nr:hypothetical protein [Candidatus Paceibacterota bacterium]
MGKSGKLISIFVLLVIFVAAVYFVAMPMFYKMSEPTGPTVEQIDNFVARETVDWTGEETDKQFSSGEMPEMLKVSNFSNLYLEIDIGGTRGLDIELNIINIGADAIILDSIAVIVNVEFTNNPGEFKEYKINILPEGETIFKGYSKSPITTNIKKSDLFGTSIKSFYIMEVKVE